MILVALNISLFVDANTNFSFLARRHGQTGNGSERRKLTCAQPSFYEVIKKTQQPFRGSGDIDLDQNDFKSSRTICFSAGYVKDYLDE